MEWELMLQAMLLSSSFHPVVIVIDVQVWTFASPIDQHGHASQTWENSVEWLMKLLNSEQNLHGGHCLIRTHKSSDTWEKIQEHEAEITNRPQADITIR